MEVVNEVVPSTAKRLEEMMQPGPEGSDLHGQPLEVQGPS